MFTLSFFCTFALEYSKKGLNYGISGNRACRGANLGGH